MITLEQIRLLESKVHKTVARMAALREENSALRQKLDTYEQRITELEGMVTAFREDQAEIEQGIITALEKLDELEDAASETEATQPPSTSAPSRDEDVVSLTDDGGDLPEEEYSDTAVAPEADLPSSTEDSDEEEESPSPTEGELDIF